MGMLVNTTAEQPSEDGSALAAAVGAPEGAAARQRLIQQVELLLRESGATEPFEAAAWVDRWLRRPNHALGGATPEAIALSIVAELQASLHGRSGTPFSARP